MASSCRRCRCGRYQAAASSIACGQATPSGARSVASKASSSGQSARAAGGGRKALQRGAGIIGLVHPIEQPPGAGHADAGHQLRHAQAGQPVDAGCCAQRSTDSISLTCAASRNFSPPNLTNGMLRRASSSSSAALWCDARNSTAWRLSAMPSSRCAQHLVGNPPRLRRLVGHRHQARPLRRDRVAPQRLGEALAGQRDHRVGGVQDRLRRAVVALQREHPRRRREARRKVEDVAHFGGAERVDRLRVVAHHREAAPVGLEREQDLGLQAVGVLVFVDQHMVEARADVTRRARRRRASRASTAAGRRSRARTGAASRPRRRERAASARPPTRRTTGTHRAAPRPAAARLLSARE